ncbi:unnamed protein product [Caenorhabditis sp. 36 PRJEB53466]|nr:unnamed protein product [Caenorhabditis sp. 36 PRJEB53466]
MSKAEMSVLERRLRPIYDALDSGNYKKSMQECEKVLKKHPTTTAAKVLKALTLIRLERASEAYEILDELDVAGVRHDDLTLQAFVHCYRDSNQPGRVVTLYEKVIQVDPNEHTLTQLFMAYSRQRMYKEQQKVGLRLFKEIGNTPYYFWTIMSVVMQAQENPALAKKMLYPLAEKMFTQQIEKTGYTAGSTAEIELQLLILEGQERWKECAEFVEQPKAAGLPMAPYNLVEKDVDYLIRDGQFKKADDICTRNLDNMPDSWGLWTHFVDSTMTQVQKLLATKKEDDLQVAKKKMWVLGEIVMYHKEKEGYKYRGPYLITFLILQKFAKMDKLGDLNALFGEFVDKLMEYVEHFYKKPVCFGDLQMFFVLLTAQQKEDFLKRLTEWMNRISAEDDVEGDESKVWATILIEKCRRTLGEYEKLDAAAHRSLFQQFIAQIAAPGRSEHAQGVLCNLTCAHLWDAYRKENDLEKFYEMVLLLEYVATSNKTDPMCKLSLIRAYAAICSTGRINVLVKTLDIKAIQLDTLGHMTFPVFETSGRFNLAIIQNHQLMMMYEQAEKEVQDCIAQAYRNGKFSAIPKMTALSNQVRNSAQVG